MEYEGEENKGNVYDEHNDDDNDSTNILFFKMNDDDDNVDTQDNSESFITSIDKVPADHAKSFHEVLCDHSIFHRITVMGPKLGNINQLIFNN